MIHHASHDPVNTVPSVQKPSRVTPGEHMVEIGQYTEVSGSIGIQTQIFQALRRGLPGLERLVTRLSTGLSSEISSLGLAERRSPV